VYPPVFSPEVLMANTCFRLKDGPRVLVCTAAGREGINLQFARVLFNFDLFWNPMDMEQRIGRIHRYGQSPSVQVCNRHRSYRYRQLWVAAESGQFPQHAVSLSKGHPDPG
jgi:superfamily II DNA/RNA helicase